MYVLLKPPSNSDIRLTYPSYAPLYTLPQSWVCGSIDEEPTLFKYYIMPAELVSGLKYYGISNHQQLRSNPFTGEVPLELEERITISYTDDELKEQMDSITWVLTTILTDKKEELIEDSVNNTFGTPKAAIFFTDHYDEAKDILANGTAPSVEMISWSDTKFDGYVLNLCEAIVSIVDTAANNTDIISAKYDSAITQVINEQTYQALEKFIYEIDAIL